MYALLFAAALVFYPLAWPQAPLIEGDSPQYMEVAADLADGRLDELHFRTVGYPLLLLLTGSTAEPTRALLYTSLGLHVASVWMLAAVFSAAGASRAWLAAMGLVLVLPPFVEPAAAVMTENLAQFTLVAGFAAMMRWWRRGAPSWLIVSAVCLSLSAVVRPVYQLLVPCLALLVMVVPPHHHSSRPRIRAPLVLGVVWVVLLGAVATFNHVRFGWFGVAPSAGFHLSTKTMGLVERLPDDYADVRELLVRERDAELVRRGGTHHPGQAVWHARPELERLTGLDLPHLSGFLVRMNLEIIRRAPFEYLQEVARSAATYWFPAPGGLAAFGSTPLRWTWGLLYGFFVAVLSLEVALAVAVLVVFASFGRQHTARLLSVIDADRFHGFSLTIAAAIVFYTMTLSCVVDIGEPRQRRSTDLLVVFLVAAGSFVWWRTTTAWRNGPARAC